MAWVNHPATAPTTATMHRGTSFSNAMYLAGGFATLPTVAGTGASNKMWGFDYISQSWTVYSSMPSGRWGHGVTSIGSKFYVFGGYPTFETSVVDPTTGATIAPRGTNTLWEWNQPTDTWTAKASCPYLNPTGTLSNNSLNAGMAVHWPEIAAIGTDIWLFAGTTCPIGTYGGSPPDENNTLFKWDSTTNTWSNGYHVPPNAGTGNLFDVQSDRWSMASAPNGKLYVIQTDPPNTGYTYNPGTNTWNSITSMTAHSSFQPARMRFVQSFGADAFVYYSRKTGGAGGPQVFEGYDPSGIPIWTTGGLIDEVPGLGAPSSIYDAPFEIDYRPDDTAWVFTKTINGAASDIIYKFSLDHIKTAQVGQLTFQGQAGVRIGGPVSKFAQIGNLIFEARQGSPFTTAPLSNLRIFRNGIWHIGRAFIYRNGQWIEGLPKVESQGNWHS